MPLSDTQLRALKPIPTTKKFSDGGGLFVQVTPQGSKLWRLAYRYGGKQKLLALGTYAAVTLADARARRDTAKRLLASGIDPSAQAKAEKAATRAATEDTFQSIADEYLKKVELEGRADATLTKKRWLVSLAAPDLGKRPISEITAADILVPLRKVEGMGNYETARRLRAMIGQVFRYAIAVSKASNDPTFGLRAH